MIPISRRFRQQATIIRTPGDYDQFGEWQAAQPVEVAATCASQPDTGTERDLGEAGARQVGRRVFWFGDGADIQLGSNGHESDRIRHDGVLYRVVEVQHWRGSHVRAVGSRVEGQ